MCVFLLYQPTVSQFARNAEEYRTSQNNGLRPRREQASPRSLESKRVVELGGNSPGSNSPPSREECNRSTHFSRSISGISDGEVDISIEMPTLPTKIDTRTLPEAKFDTRTLAASGQQENHQAGSIEKIPPRPLQAETGPGISLDGSMRADGGTNSKRLSGSMRGVALGSSRVLSRGRAMTKTFLTYGFGYGDHELLSDIKRRQKEMQAGKGFTDVHKRKIDAPLQPLVKLNRGILSFRTLT
eukprot:g79504.t1